MTNKEMQQLKPGDIIERVDTHILHSSHQFIIHKRRNKHSKDGSNDFIILDCFLVGTKDLHEFHKACMHVIIPDFRDTLIDWRPIIRL